MKNHIVLSLLILSSFTATGYTQNRPEECTVGVAAASATADGRPLLWKNRDNSMERNNEIVYFEDGRFKYLALVTAGQSKSVWAGVNEFGFSIMNSVSDDLPGANKSGLGNGAMMKLALQQCVTADDFEKILKKSNVSGRTTKTNYGVIDAFGGAAFFETAHNSYTRFDATDPEIAPDGYLIRANFAMTADGHAGRTRCQRGDQLWKQAVQTNSLDCQYVLRTVCRDLADANDVPDLPPEFAEYQSSNLINTYDAISRSTTVSVALFHGVKPDENPSLTTFWAILGEPTFSIAVPCWVIAESTAPELDGPRTSPLCSTARDLHAQNYLVINRKTQYLIPDRLDEIRALLYPAEDQIFDQTEQILNQWRQDYPTAQQVAQFHQKMAQLALQTLIQTRDKLKKPIFDI